MPPYNPDTKELTKPKVEIVQTVSKIKSPLPEHIQKQVDNITKQTNEQKETQLKIEVVFQALENKYPDFDRTKFKIQISWLNKKDLNYLWYWVFLLYSKESKLLSYIKDNWETILDMTNFEPYMDSFEENMMKHIGIEIWIWKDWKWYKRSKKHWIIKEWSLKFDRYIISKYVLKE